MWTAGNTATVEITSLGGSPITQLTNLTWKANTNNEWFGVYQIEVYYNGAYHTVTQGGVNSFYLQWMVTRLVKTNLVMETTGNQ